MAVIAPFRALRYDTKTSGSLRELTCPPYDIISPKAQAELESVNPRNVIRLERPLGENCYQKAGETLRAWLDEGVLKPDDQPAYYLYRLDFETDGKPDSIYGFFARVRVEDFETGVIRPHEETLSKDKSDRLNLMRETLCNISPIYGLYRDDTRNAATLMERVMQTPPLESFTDADGVTHSLWMLDGTDDTEVLTRALTDQSILIADGHHRYETALAFRDEKNPERLVDHPANFCLMFLAELSHPGLVVWPTHRLLRDLPAFELASVLASLETQFKVEALPSDAARRNVPAGSVVLYADQMAYRLTPLDAKTIERALPDRSAAYRALDVAMLHSLILEPFFGIDKKNMADQKNLIYTRDLNEAIQGVDAGDFQCAFLLASTPVSSVGDVSASGERMPQKSTYFYPKLTTGLVINRLV